MIYTDFNFEYAYSEVLEILKYIPKSDYNKIPKEKIKVFENGQKQNIKIQYDPKKTLKENNISKTARGIIAILYRDYWTTEEQRKIILEYQDAKRKIIEEEKRKKYSGDVFKRENFENTSESKNIEPENVNDSINISSNINFELDKVNNLPVEIPKEKLTLQKVINYILNFFKFRN